MDHEYDIYLIFLFFFFLWDWRGLRRGGSGVRLGIGTSGARVLGGLGFCMLEGLALRTHLIRCRHLCSGGCLPRMKWMDCGLVVHAERPMAAGRCTDCHLRRVICFSATRLGLTRADNPSRGPVSPLPVPGSLGA